MRGYRLRNTGSILLALITAAAVLGASRARAAEPVQKVVRVGYVGGESPSTTARGLSEFWDRLRELGWVQGRNLIREEGWAQGQIERLPALMADMVERKVDVLVTASLTGETPRLCRGGSSSLTFTGVHRGNSAS